MYKFSFKVAHKGCYETAFSKKFPKHHITVVDIQSTDLKKKQYFYYISGDAKQFDSIFTHLTKSKGYKFCKEIERSKETLLLLVVLDQSSYIQNVILENHGFFIDLHTCLGGYEYWHIGCLERSSIDIMLKQFKKMGDLKVLSIGEVDFGHTLLSVQQKKVFQYAHDNGYYEQPRKTTISAIAKALKLTPATVGEHLLKAENKLIHFAAKKI